MNRQKVDVSRFAMVPRPDVPRARFKMTKNLKTTFDAGILYPIFCEEVLPGDSFSVSASMLARLSTPIFPIFDNIYLDSHFFFVPNRLVWENWQKFMGERTPNPDSSISYSVPMRVSDAGGYTEGSIFDYFGLPCAGQITGTYEHSALPLRGYNLIYNEWYRDQNLIDSAEVPTGDGPDTGVYALRRRAKRHDYFTSCLPWPQKGDSVPLPLGGTAPVSITGSGQSAPSFQTLQGVPGTGFNLGTMVAQGSGGDIRSQNNPTGDATMFWNDPNLVGTADLASATATTINALRQAFQIQKVLERDARGGTRYTEIIRSHFGVVSPDARLQRPEYLGGGTTMVNINPIAQTSGSPGAGGYTDTPLGTLSAFGTAHATGHGFSQSFTEHGYIIGILSVRADLTYQQGLRRHWSRESRFDFYLPAFAHLGEQAVLSKELFCRGEPDDELVFGYQERWAELRYIPSEITATMRSTAPGTLDAWHLAQNFVNRPLLVGLFIEENPPLERALAVGSAAGGQQFYGDFFFQISATRPIPLYSVPGLIDHF